MNSRQFSFPPLKSRLITRYCKIIATSAYYPEIIVTNQEIIDHNNLPVTDIAVRRTNGVERRRKTPHGMVDSDLLTEAAKGCLAKAGINSEQLSHLIVTKFLGDRMLPMTAALVQKKLGSRKAFQCYDIEGGVNSFITALDMGTRYVNSGASYVLVVSGGIAHRLTDSGNPRMAFLFGDGAAAILLGPAEEPHFLSSYAYTNYVYYNNAVGFGVADTLPSDLYEKQDFSILYHTYRMGNWKESAEFYLQAAKITRDRLLESGGLSGQGIDWVLVTENNKRLRDMTLEHLGIAQDRSLSAIADYGNTMSAMLPGLLNKGFNNGKFAEGMHIMLISHGEGADGGGILYRV